MAVLAGHFPQTSQVVIPAKAGIHVEQSFDGWVPACAGTTALAFSALLVGAVRLSFGFRPLLGRLTFLVSTRKVSKRNDPGGAGWRCAPTTLLCSGFAGALELARYAGSNRQGPFFRKTFRASAAQTGILGQRYQHGSGPAWPAEHRRTWRPTMNVWPAKPGEAWMPKRPSSGQGWPVDGPPTSPRSAGHPRSGPDARVPPIWVQLLVTSLCAHKEK